MAEERVPVSFIMDDAPTNSAYLLRDQMTKAGLPVGGGGGFEQRLSRWREMEKSALIPVAFWKEFASWAKEAGVKGKFTFLPNPGGFGYIDREVKGYLREDLRALVALVREEYAPLFDITPECFTHTMGWDWKNGKLLDVTEHDYISSLDEQAMTEYFAEAVRALKRAGITATGITQPCNFRGDEEVYARAVLNALKSVNGLKHAFYFLNCDATSPEVRPAVMYADPARDEYTVSIISAIRADEPFWDTIYGEGDVSGMADYFITADGKAGRLVDLLKTKSPLVFHAHSQTLYSNGTEKGFQSLQEVVRRLEKHHGGRIRWVKNSELAEEAIAARKAAR